MSSKRIFYVVNVDWFFLSHRMPLALEAIKRGYEVFVLTNDTGKKKEIEAGGVHFIDVNFERSGKNPLKDLYHIYELFVLYRKYKPELIHHISIKPSIYGTIAARLARVDGRHVINAISGLGAVFSKEGKSATRFVVKTLMNIAFGKHCKFIFQNPDDKQLYESLGYLAPYNYKIIKGSGVDTTVYTYEEPIIKDKIHIVLSARMLYDKGILEFVAAAMLLKRKYEGKILFVLVGGIDDFNPAAIAREDVVKLTTEGYIEWKGHVKDMRQENIMADIVCLPSYREGLPKSLVEAMAVGRPIVTTDVPGCRECVIQDVNGYIVPAKNETLLAEALEKLIVNTDLRIEMGKASRRIMEEEMSLNTVLNTTFNFYQE